MQEFKKEKLKIRLKDKLFLACLAFLLFFIGYEKFFSSKKNDETSAASQKEEIVSEKTEKIILQVGETVLQVDLADEPEERFVGLGERSQLAEDEGMLFLHEKSGTHKYSMRGMLFGLDFIFINKGQVVDFRENVAVDFSGEIVGQTEYDSVLEVPADWVKKNGIQVGDKVSATK